MYSINDYVIHQNNHIYQIIAINNQLTLKSPLNNNSILADSKDIIRKVTTKKELEEIIERIPYIRTLEITSERFRQELYRKTFDSYLEIEWIKLIKTIYLQLLQVLLVVIYLTKWLLEIRKIHLKKL